MKLSVIIPCFNGANTIAVQLEALANQYWSEPWEIIVSNNGSTDETVAVVERYIERLPNLHIVDASDRQGQAHAINIGVLAATGDALAFCDADDEVAPGWVAAMGEALSKYDLVAGSLEFRKLNEAWQVQNRGVYNGLNQPKHPPFLPSGGNCNLGLKRSLYEAIGGFDESLFFVQDVEYCWRAQLAGTELHFVPNALVHYRLRNTLVGKYRQARNWSEEYVSLRKRCGGLSGRFTKLKLIVGGWRWLIAALLRIRSRGDFAEWLWQFGWKIGELQGAIKTLSVFLPQGEVLCLHRSKDFVAKTCDGSKALQGIQ